MKRIAAVAGGVLMAFGMWSCESTGDEWKDMPDSYRVDYGEVVMVRSAGRNECLIRRDDNLISVYNAIWSRMRWWTMAIVCL